MKTVTKIIWPVAVLAVVLATASCASKSKGPVNNQANQTLRGGVHVPMHVRVGDRVGKPISVGASAAQPEADYRGTGGSMSGPSQYRGFQPERVTPPKRYCYIDAMACPPRPGGPR